MYFHVSEKSWEIGEVIEPGNFGRRIVHVTQPSHIVNQPGTEVGPFVRTMMWEAALEASRMAYAPSAPSRSAVVFLSESLELARRFRDRFKQGHSIFSVIPITDIAPSHKGDFSVFEDVPEPFFNVIAARSRQYWVNQTPAIPEILWAGPVAVNSLIE